MDERLHLLDGHEFLYLFDILYAHDHDGSLRHPAVPSIGKQCRPGFQHLRIGGILSLVYGKVSELDRPRKLLFISLGLFLAASLLYLPINNLYLLLIVRFIHGSPSVLLRQRL